VLDQAKAVFPDVNEKDKILGVLPFYHIYGAHIHPFDKFSLISMADPGGIMVLHLSFALGCPLVIMSQFDPHQFCANIEKYRITIALIVPSSLDVLATHPGSRMLILSYWRISHDNLQLLTNTICRHSEFSFPGQRVCVLV
jgi:4-coumarate--CoA ligase